MFLVLKSFKRDDKEFVPGQKITKAEADKHFKPLNIMKMVRVLMIHDSSGKYKLPRFDKSKHLQLAKLMNKYFPDTKETEKVQPKAKPKPKPRARNGGRPRPTPAKPETAPKPAPKPPSKPPVEPPKEGVDLL